MRSNRAFRRSASAAAINASASGVVSGVPAKFAAVNPDFDPIENERGVGYRLNLKQAASSGAVVG